MPLPIALGLLALFACLSYAMLYAVRHAGIFRSARISWLTYLSFAAFYLALAGLVFWASSST